MGREWRVFAGCCGFLPACNSFINYIDLTQICSYYIDKEYIHEVCDLASDRFVSDWQR